MQKFLTLIITIAILYTIVQLNLRPKTQKAENPPAPQAQSQVNKEEKASDQPLTGNFLEKTLSSVLINVLKTDEGRTFFENVLQPMNQPITGTEHSFKINQNLIAPLFKINSFDTGTIGPVSCGHVVTVHYQILTMNNLAVDEGTKTFMLGSKVIMPGLDSVIVGMKIGETRQAIIPAKYAFMDAKDKKNNIDPQSPYKINVVLQEVLPHTFIKEDEVKVFDDEIGYRLPLMCGNNVTFDAKITRLSDGTVIYDSQADKQPINISIGDVSYPLIFSYALHGKIPSGTRTVITKGRTFQGLGANVTKIFPQKQLPLNEYYMLELKNFQ